SHLLRVVPEWGLGAAVGLASARPRELLGLPVTGVEVGHPADLMLFAWAPGGAVRVRRVL
ncbi:MAG TPA: N-acetylglucosamine-6-phosphate deacetylase, partial [Gemmata sp.]